MRGSRRIGLLAISVVCVFAFTAASALAVEDDQLFTTNAGGGTALRELTTAPAGFPESAEFVNSGEVVLKASVVENKCTEIAFGTFVTKNKLEEDPVLSLPYGVAEGDNCNFSTYFGVVSADAAHPGSLEASVTVKDEEPEPNPVRAYVKNLQFALLGTAAGTCVYGVSGAEELVGNVTSPNGAYGEEGAAPNLTVSFSGKKVKKQALSGGLCPAEGELATAVFVLETPSTTTDGAFYKS